MRDLGVQRGLAFYDRYLLTVEEAAVYFYVGYKKTRSMVKEHVGAKWILFNGNRIMIKREQFELLSLGKTSALFKREQPLKRHQFWMHMKRRLLYLETIINMKL